MTKKPVQDSPKSVFVAVDSFFTKHQKMFFWISIGLFTLTSLLLFNVRVSEGGDDSTYIIRALNLWNKGTYPTYQGPVYPMVLSLIAGIGGLKLGLLKVTSLVFLVGFLVLFYRSFKNRISNTTLFLTLLLFSVNSFVAYFSSQTYSEALFMLLQIPVFLLLFNYSDRQTTEVDYKQLIIISLFIVLGFFTRTVGLGALIAVVIYFLVQKQYKELVMVVVSFLVITALFLFLKDAIWDNGFFENKQANTLIYVDPYDFSKGKESFTGYFGRFVDNSNLYLSKHLMILTGFRDALSLKTDGIVTILLYAIFIFGFISAFKKNKYLLFAGIYTVIMLGITFITLQKLWDQYRLIVPYFPFMLLLIIYGLKQIIEKIGNKKGIYVLLGLFAFSFFSTASQSLKTVDLMTLRSNINGNRFDGYSNDWANYLKMAEYIGNHLPEDTYVACRKPNMSRIYANGKEFYGIYRFQTTDADSLLNGLRERNVTHVLVGSLRKNPRVNNGEVINTIHRYMSYILQKYPKSLRLTKKIGGTEPAHLFEIIYPLKQSANKEPVTN